MELLQKRVTFINSDPSIAMAENANLMPNPLDPNAPPIKIRKKPGRKPNPASPALRKAQNRAAQRAFRERKERHLKELEDTIKALKENQDVVCTQFEAKIQEKQANVDALQRENEYLKGIVLSLQATLSQHGIQPPATPSFLDECDADPDSGVELVDLDSSTSSRESLDSPGSSVTSFDDTVMTTILPIDVSTASSSAHAFLDTIGNGFTLASDHRSSPVHNPDFVDTNTFPDFLASSGGGGASPNSCSFTDSFFGDEFSSEMPLIDPILSVSAPIALKEESAASIASVAQRINNDTMDPRPVNILNAPHYNVTAIEMIKIQLLLQETSKKNGVPFTIKPSLIQMNVPHDPRIDLVPCSFLRDRMIILRDQYDLDALCDLLVNKATFHGGNPTDPSSWELPEEFFDRFWFLCVDVNAERTNRWRKARGAPAVRIRQSEVDCKIITQT